MWIHYPIVTVSTPLGFVQLAFTEGSHVAVSDAGKAKGEEGYLTYRNVPMRGMAHFYRAGDGTWYQREGDRAGLTRADKFLEPAPRTYAAKAVEAMLEAVNTYTSKNPDVVREAEYANANNAADNAAGEVRQLEEKLAEARAALTSAQDRMRANAPSA